MILFSFPVILFYYHPRLTELLSNAKKKKKTKYQEFDYYYMSNKA